MILRTASALGLALTLLPSTAVAQHPGAWSAPFNHVGLPSWAPGLPDWDAEPRGPYATAATLHQFMAAHMSLIPVGPHRGKLLVWNWMRAPIGKQHWAIVDVTATPPTFQNFDLPVTSAGDLFCSGHAWTKDGHLLVAGGNGIGGANNLVWRFNPMLNPPSNLMWQPERPTVAHRWYPTVTALGTDSTGKDLLAITGGYDFPSSGLGRSRYSYEVFDPAGTLGQGTWQVNPVTGGRVFYDPGLSCAEDFAVYPRVHLLGSGKLFFSGFTDRGYRLDQTLVSGGSPATWEIQAVANPTLHSRWYGSSFLFPNINGPTGGWTDVVVKTGGFYVDMTNCFPQLPPIAPPSNPLATTEFCFADAPTTNPLFNWQGGPSMAFPRYHHNTVLLPDASVLAVGGNRDAGELDCAQPELMAELFNDAPFTWRSMSAGTVRRGYHSAAVLLPDGRVLVGGGEQREMDYEIFSPHYLLNGTTRPVIQGAPSTLVMNYGQTYTLPYTGVTVEKAVLMAPASLTHHSDMHQRYWEMQPVTPPPPNPNPNFSFQAPANSNQAPKGYYMLFYVSTVQAGAYKGTPSNAIWVQLQ